MDEGNHRGYKGSSTRVAMTQRASDIRRAKIVHEADELRRSCMRGQSRVLTVARNGRNHRMCGYYTWFDDAEHLEFDLAGRRGIRGLRENCSLSPVLYGAKGWGRGSLPILVLADSHPYTRLAACVRVRIPTPFPPPPPPNTHTQEGARLRRPRR